MTPQERLRQRITVLLNLEPGNVSSDIILRTLVRECEAAGWKIVPIDPTEEMEMDGKCELVALASDLATSKWAAHKVYKAMIEKAPKVTE